MSEMRVRRRDRRGWYLVIAVFVGVALFTFLHNSARNDEVTVEAASLADFDPGYIISDYQMGRYDAMSEAEIQAFLTSKNACKNTNYNQYLSLSANSAAKWHFENGHFVCLSEELFGDGEVIGSGETAAHIIWQAAQDYKINPQALLVLLQKETSLITDTIPNNYDYRKATGYGCPDTAPCSAEYYGFKNQVRKAAALFRQVLDGGWTNYPLGNNYVQYNPAAACGGSVVNIRSLATSALYRYTPYQPNAAAITAGYGYGDTCSAYGNRNFYLYFEDWFGGAKEEKGDIEEILKNINKVPSEESDLGFKYSAHLQGYVWTDDVEAGEMIGTVGYGIAIDAFKIAIEDGGIEYKSHVSYEGWESEFRKDGEVSGVVGNSRQIEAVQIRLDEKLSHKYDVYYRVHVQNLGWMDWVENGETAGTTGQSLRLEAIEVKLSDGLEEKYDIMYRVHVQNLGWMDWVENGETAGTTGQSLRLEAIEVKLVEK